MNAFLEQNSQNWASLWPDGQKDNLYVSSWELQSALFAQNRSLRPKNDFLGQNPFWAQNAFSVPKFHFEDFGPKWLHFAFVLQVFGAKRKKCDFCVGFSKNEFLWKINLTTQNLEIVFRIFHKNDLFDTSDFTTAVRKSVYTPWPPFPGEHFGAQKRILGPKSHFGPKIRFGAQNAFPGYFCPLAADAYETNSFCIGF